MAHLDTLITLLASQFRDHPHLRDALIQTMLTVLAEEQQPQTAPAVEPNYFVLLNQVREQQVLAAKTGQVQTERALHELAETIRTDLHQTALALHSSLRAGQFQPEKSLVQRLGIDINDFPVGFPQDINLLTASNRYLQLARDLNVMTRYFPQQRFSVSQHIRHEQQQAARWLQDVALEALASSNAVEQLKFHRQCLTILQNRRIEAENNLLTILKGSDPPNLSQQVEQMEGWLQQYGNLGRNILKSLSSAKHSRTLLSLQIRTRDYTGLEALIVREPIGKDEKLFFDVLMLVRFGGEFQNSAHAWKNWLKKRIDDGIHRTRAIAFLKSHSAALPILLEETMLLSGIESPDIPAALQTAYAESIGRSPIQIFLERWRSELSIEEIQHLESIAPEPIVTPPPLPSETAFSLDEVQIEEALSQTTEEQKPQDDVSPPALLEGAIETAVDAGIEGNLAESALISVLDKGSEAFGGSFTVEIEDEEEMPVAPPVEKPRRLRRKKTPKPLSTEAEESIWNDHIFPFIRANLVFVLAPSLIFVGLLLLVLTLWDKAVWIRYGLTPLMLVSVSYALARIGLWLKGEDLRDELPIAIMQSVAIFLAPLSLLFVALLSVDKQLALSVRVLWGVFLSIALLAAWWYIFALAINAVSRKTARIHSYTLLLLNALLLLLPIAQFIAPAGNVSLHFGAKMILVAGFYLGFLTLFWSMRRVLAGMATVDASLSRIPMIFYSATCIGTFALVWGLTHARLLILPHPHTYGPLLLLLSALISMSEFTLLDIREQRGRITSLSYSAYFCVGLGVLLSIGHDYVRVVSLLLAGLVWFYQAVKLRDNRHFNISMVILTLAFSMIALVRDFPPPFFPYLTLIVISALYLISLTVPYKDVALLAAKLTPVYMSFAFIVSILWQWAGKINPTGYGIAFAIFGLSSIYLGAKINKLVHVHAGAGYLVAALPYLGMMNMKLYTLEGNTLVFGLALVGMFWTMMNCGIQNAAIRDSRSTVLWNIGILAFCLMCLRVFLGETLDSFSNPLLQVQILSGPILIAALMLLAGYFTRSYVPVYLALVVLVIIFPEIKDRFNIPMYSGLGSTFSGLGFLALVVLLSRWKLLRKERKIDLIWRKKPFPFRAKNDYLLHANPLVVAAFFLFTRTIFVTYPQNVFRPLMPFSLKTCLAVVLSGTAYHFISVWFKKSWFSYFGFIAVCFGIVHSCFLPAGGLFSDRFLPFFILAAFLFCAAIQIGSTKMLSERSVPFIAKPYRHLRVVVLWLFAFSLYALYTGYDILLIHRETGSFVYWLPLVAYLCGIAIGLGWKSSSAKRSWVFWIPAYFLLWQFILLIASRGMPLFKLLEAESLFLVTTSVMGLGIAASFFPFELLVGNKKFRILSPLLWISFVFLFLFSPLLVAAFYLDVLPLLSLPVQLILWALVSLILGRFLNLGPLWLWSVFLAHLLLLQAVGGRTRFYTSFHPFTLACIALFLAGLSNLFANVRWLFEHKHSWPWAKKPLLSPSFLFAVVSHLIVVIVFVLSMYPQYQHEWLTVLGLFLAAFPALFSAHQLGFSRHFLFGVPYTLAWIALMLALRFHFPENGWLEYLSTLQIIAIGLFGALLTAVLSDIVLPCKDRMYHVLKFIGATGIIGLIIATYLSLRNVELLSWQWLITSAILSLGAGFFLGYLAKGNFKLRYGFFVCGITISMYCFGLLLLKYVLGLEMTLATIFSILVVPPFYFWGCNEIYRLSGVNHSPARSATTILWSGVLVVYIFPFLVALLMLPNYLPEASHYFLYAPVAIVCGLALIRLHALGGSPLLVLAGVAVEVIAIFFFVTRMIILLLGEVPTSSTGKTFEFFTLVATGLSYLLLLGTGEHGFLKKALIWFGNIQGTLWQIVRILLIALCLGASHVLLLISVANPAGQQYIGSILLLLAGLWLHVGYDFHAMIFYSLSYSEILAALFSCLAFDAIWSESWIIWTLLVFFGAIIVIYSQFLKDRYAHAASHVYVWLSITAALILFEHITFYGLSSKLGLVPLFLLWIMTFCIPSPVSSRQYAGLRIFLGVLIYAPALFFFLQQGPPSLMHLPRTLLTTVIISALMVAYRMYEWQWFSDEEVEEPRIAHHLHWYLNQPHSLLFIFLLSSLAVVVMHIISFLAGPELFASQFFSMLVVQGFLTVFWFDLARKDKKWWWTIAAEMMIAGIIFTLRQDLPLLFRLPWDVNWDLAIGVFVAFAITAARPLLRKQDSSIRIPIRFTLFGLPIVMALYALDYDVGFPVFSRMLLIYSVLFIWQAYSEKDRFVLAYAFLGINSYLILLFLHSEIHSLQAYVTPVCISILILVQVFRDITSATTANIVRGLTLCILLGMAAFEAIVQNSSSPLAHGVVMLLSIFAIVIAIFLHIKIFAIAGLLGFVLDLIAVLYIVLSQQNVDTLKVILGLGFTLGGGLILSGYILYRKNRESIERIMTKITIAFAAWE